MIEESASCPFVEVKGDCLVITNDPYDPHREVVNVESYDVDAFIVAVIAARDKLKEAGHLTAWSRDADGKGNCGRVQSHTSWMTITFNPDALKDL
jgi:predicted metal-dependent phosphoesterase TrpH